MSNFSSKGSSATIWSAEASGTAPGDGAAATGSITTVAVANLVDGETFTFNDGLGSAGGAGAVTFEFNVSGSHITDVDNIEVDVSGDTTADDVRDTIISIVNATWPAGLGPFSITASSGGAATVTMTNDFNGTHGNTTSSETVTNGTFAVTNMASGTAVGGVALPQTQPRHRRFVVQIKKNTGAGDVTLTGPVTVYGWDNQDAHWYSLGTLNDGSSIVVGDQGYAELINDVGIYSRIGLSAAGITASHSADATVIGVEATGAI